MIRVPSMTPIERAKAMLPNMPDEVFKLFIAEMFIDTPWPFSNIDQSLIGTKWYYYFGGLSLRQFSNLRWKIYNFMLDKNILHPDSYGDAARLIKEHVLGIETPIRNVRKTKERFFGLVKYIERTKKFPAPIITIRTEFNNLRVLDGSHRLAALYALELDDKIPIDAWIGQ
jgi:hypothetical protein